MNKYFTCPQQYSDSDRDTDDLDPGGVTVNGSGSDMCHLRIMVEGGKYWFMIWHEAYYTGTGDWDEITKELYEALLKFKTDNELREKVKRDEEEFGEFREWKANEKAKAMKEAEMRDSQYIPGTRVRARN